MRYDRSKAQRGFSLLPPLYRFSCARDIQAPDRRSGRLIVSVAKCPTGVAIGVRDTGTGIAREFCDRVFEPLQTTKGERGTGLGLAISRRVITSAGGRLTFETEVGRGTLFLIELPVIPGSSRARTAMAADSECCCGRVSLMCGRALSRGDEAVRCHRESKSWFRPRTRRWHDLHEQHVIREYVACGGARRVLIANIAVAHADRLTTVCRDVAERNLPSIDSDRRHVDSREAAPARMDVGAPDALHAALRRSR